MPHRDYRAWNLPPTTTRGPSLERLEALKELNFQCFELLAAQSRAASGGDFPLGGLIELWNSLDSAARVRAVDYPYLLFDAGFTDPQRWRRPLEPLVNESRAEPYESFFTVPGAVQVAWQVFVHAWSSAREYPTNAILTLGMHPQSAKLIAAHTSASLYRMVERHWTWLRPRWLDKPEFWHELLLGGVEGGEAHASALLHGVRLLTAELATAQHRREKRFRR